MECGESITVVRQGYPGVAEYIIGDDRLAYEGIVIAAGGAAGRIRAAAIVLWDHAAVPSMSPMLPYPSIGMLVRWSSLPTLDHSSLLAAHDVQPHLLRSQLTLAALLRIALDPTVAIGTLLAAGLAFGEPLDGHYLTLMVVVFSLTFPGSVPRGTTIRRLAGDVLTGWLVIVALLLLLGWATGTLGSFEHRVILAWLVATPVALFAAHLLVPVVLPRVLAAEGVRRVAVVAGANELGCKLAGRLRSTPLLGVRFAGYFDDRASERIGNVRPGEVLGSLNQLAEYANRDHVDLIYIALPMASRPRILRLLDQLRDTTASIYVAPDIFLFDLIQARLDTIGDIPVVAVCETPFYGINGLIKRVSDLALASLILVLVAPLMLAIAIGVKLGSPGPALFKQRRYGLDGREIIVYKFRTMTVLEDGDVVRQATRGDPRVTSFGAFLRRYSLDELPQFINVLQGRMSVVGPRPYAVAHNEMYRKLINGHMIRHKVKPGITGWAQIHGLRGEPDDIGQTKACIEYDLAYLRNWSLRFDLQIVLKTIFFVLKRANDH
jgi:putative colanic acid biosynthesis UDP-glucose lipid carrier transferase